MSYISLIIISVYNANKCGDATQLCRTPCLMLIHSLRSLSHHTAAVWVQYRFIRSHVSASSTSSDCSSSTNESCLTVSKALLSSIKQVYTSFCFSTYLSTSLFRTNMVFLVPLSGINPYWSGDTSCSVLPLIPLITIQSTSFVIWLIRPIVRCFSHLVAPFTFGNVINIDLFILLEKHLECTSCLTVLWAQLSPCHRQLQASQLLYHQVQGISSLTSLVLNFLMGDWWYWACGNDWHFIPVVIV